MKKIKLFLAASCCLMLGGATGCSDFGDVNTDPEHLTAANLDRTLEFTDVQQYVYGTDYEEWRNAVIYISTMLQHTASTQSYFNGDKYTYDSGYNSAYWDRIFPNGIRNAVDVLNAWNGQQEHFAAIQMMRIMKVLLFERMTDQYGDVPYTEAGLGYLEGKGYPKYDTQQSIYMDLLKELNEAAQNLGTVSSSNIGAADLIYGGNVAKWRKFAYSLMLRTAMHLTKVDPATAEQWVKTAVAGGVIMDNADNAVILHPDAVATDNSIDGFCKIIGHEAPNDYRLSQFFVNLLKDSNDPRLPLIATVCTNPGITCDQPNYDMGDTAFVKQIGMPNGYDNNAAATDITKAPGYPGDENNYSVFNRYTFANEKAPTMVLTNAEDQLLLAEAAERGWVQGSAKDYYEAGVKAAMQQFSTYGVAAPSEARIAEYLKENPYDSSKALEQINTQYYVATLGDEYETFANWRRSGYPVLKPVNYFGNVTNGTIPRRFTYPTDEANSNTANYQAAIKEQGWSGDLMTQRVWIDPEK